MTEELRDHKKQCFLYFVLFFVNYMPCITFKNFCHSFVNYTAIILDVTFSCSFWLQKFLVSIHRLYLSRGTIKLNLGHYEV